MEFNTGNDIAEHLVVIRRNTTLVALESDVDALTVEHGVRLIHVNQRTVIVGQPCIKLEPDNICFGFIDRTGGILFCSAAS